MSANFITEELLLAERVLSRVEKLTDPSAERRRLGLRDDEANDALINWQIENSFYKSLDQVIDQLHLVAKSVREKSDG